MVTSFHLTLFTILTWLSIGFAHVPTDERGDPNYRRTTNIDVNQVRSTIYNWGYTGKTATYTGYGYEWPVNSGNEYIWLTGLAVGAEIESESGDSSILISTILRNDATGKSLSWEPVKEYLNSGSEKIAISDDPNTWPSYWPDKMEDGGWSGSWNGFFGKDKFSAEQEIFYKISDDGNNPEGFDYIPDSTDHTRKGLGLLSGVRIMQWKQVLIEDVVFQLYDITNDGTKDLEKVAFSLWYADYIGADGNDLLEFDLMTDVAWNYDLNHSELGTVAISYIETPGNNVDRIDNDGDSTPLDFSRCDIDFNCEVGGPPITEEMLAGEIFDGKDNNGNGLVDENESHLSFGDAPYGVAYADRVDNDGDAEADSPVVTEEMVAATSTDWGIWPPADENYNQVHLIGISSNDVGKAFSDGIDNDGNCSMTTPYIGCELDSPVVTAEMISAAQSDPFGRYVVRDASNRVVKIVYALEDSDLGKAYADGIDNDGDGAVDEGIDENIDEMIDESRDDFVDNDGDWNPEDDLGLSGDGFSSGANNGVPTSGSGTGFPGEPNIDKTDVSESDQMGLTSVTWSEENSGLHNNNSLFWSRVMTPGILEQPVGTDNDLYVSSGFFPLKAGQTERIAMAISLGNDQQDALRNRNTAQTAYESDYQFAKSPDVPVVSAVPGDGEITLYWDSDAELSEDAYMAEITEGEVRYDFEGYKIYRSTDWQFKEALFITDGDGNPTFYKPYVSDGESAQWDLVNGKKGWHPVDLNGVKFYLGDDTGLRHSFTDTDVVNGQKYYYAVVAYDFGGDETNNIIPSDSPMRLRINSLTGEIEKGPNVVEVTPREPAAGYVQAPSNTNISHIFGGATGSISYEVVDPGAVINNGRYKVTFRDTLLENSTSSIGHDTLTTGAYYLIDTSQNTQDTLLNNYPLIGVEEHPVIEGIRLNFNNIPADEIKPDTTHSGWVSQSTLWDFTLSKTDGSIIGLPFPADYRIVFIAEDNITTSCYCGKKLNNNPSFDPCSESFIGENPSDFCTASFYEEKEVNFLVQKLIWDPDTKNEEWENIPFAFGDYSPYNAETLTSEPDGKFNADWREQDRIVFLDNLKGDIPSATWFFTLDYPGEASEFSACCNEPQPGDSAYIFLKKPFLSSDVFEFITTAPTVDKTKAREELKDIFVIPNPYIAANAFEADNIFTSGRGPREIQFRNLPAQCTIRIYTVSGERVKTIDHFTSIDNGMASWNLLSEDNLSIAYGVYIFHVEAPGIGEHLGKFAVIK
ncbi:MAG: hypothetical protein QGF36_02465 [Candidatus Marinimicrobia bacterium]|nr:hypothetical protein [Candidatus Neomarinimicrobiota bacterium]MDP6852961.1 hypothetical protein [Candidatus Neomarinimicrobiota bacterium]MDP6936275.1 hypothetical protein [Candidatus Neomarinimicrobiota bacterium]